MCLLGDDDDEDVADDHADDRYGERKFKRWDVIVCNQSSVALVPISLGQQRAISHFASPLMLPCRQVNKNKPFLIRKKESSAAHLSPSPLSSTRPV